MTAPDLRPAAGHRRYQRAPAFDVFAVATDGAQFVWRDLGDQHHPVAVTDADGAVLDRFDVRGGPSSRWIGPLAPDATHTLRVAGQDIAFRTLDQPVGRHLARIATLNDVHIGSTSFGLTGIIRERPAPEVEAGERCARAAFAEIALAQPDHLVIKGDFVHHNVESEWTVGREMIDNLGVPWDIALGNHEARTDGAGERSFALAGRPTPDPFRVSDVGGVRVITADTTIALSDRGTLRDIGEPVLAAAADAPGPVLVFLHHNLQPRRFAWMIPSGVSGTEANPFLDRLRAVAPRSLVASGHTHRHRTRLHHGIPVVEVGSPKDHPGTWACYDVHEDGVVQVVRRVGRSDCLAWTDWTRRAALGTWGRWSRGALADRCFSHRWPVSRSS